MVDTCITKTILKWVDEKEREVYANDDDKLMYAKEIGLGVIEGVVDGCFLVGALCSVFVATGKVIISITK